MPHFAANLSLLFTEHAFLDRFEVAARAGFRGVEFLFPYGERREAIAERLARHGLVPVLHNLPPGDWQAGERGIAILPERIAEFRDGVGLAIDYARTLGCTQLHAMAGIAPDGVSAGLLEETFVENLAYAARETGRAGIRLLIEPINTRDIPGYFLTGSAQALDLIAQAGSDDLFLQYDLYHMRMMGEDLAGTLATHLGRIAHLQLADAPGRHEPGTGAIDFPALFAHLDAIGYAGWIGCEYRPRAATLDGLGWLDPYRPL